MHQLPHASNRADDRGRERPQPHIQVHRTRGSRTSENAQLLQYLPYRQNRRLGDRRSQAMGKRIAMEGGQLAIDENLRPRRERTMRSALVATVCLVVCSWSE